MELENLNTIIDQVSKDKGVSRDVLVEALEAAMLTAARKVFGPEQDLEAHYDPETGRVQITEWRTVVSELENNATEILLDKAREELDPECEIGDSLGRLVGELPSGGNTDPELARSLEALGYADPAGADAGKGRWLDDR